MLSENGKLINPEVRIENTSKCNAACIICPREKLTRPQVTMLNGHYLNLVEQAYHLGAKSIGAFGFGEPLLDDKLPQKIEYISKRGLESHITTNASLLNLDMIWRLLDAGLTQIRFSVHAISPSTYSNVHRGLSWFETTKNIFNFININEKLGHKCTTHMIVIPLHGESVDEIRDTWESATDYLEVWKPHNWLGGRGYREGRQKKLTCGRLFSGPVQIQADGTVIPCCFITNSEIVLGNTYKNTIYEILMSDEYEKLRMAHRIGKLQSWSCVECDQLFDNGVESPLLYSNLDKEMKTGKTSIVKFNLE